MVVSAIECTSRKNMHALGKLNGGGAFHHEDFDAIADIARENDSGGGAGDGWRRCATHFKRALESMRHSAEATSQSSSRA